MICSTIMQSHSVKRSSVIACTLVLSLLPTPAVADEAAGRDGDATRIATLILRGADAAVDPELADSLTELVITLLSTSGSFAAVGKEKVKGLLGVEDELRALECIASPACLGALATHLGVSKALVGTIERAEGRYRVSLTLINLLNGKTENSMFLEVAGDETALVERVGAIAIAAATPRPDPGSIAVTANVKGATVFVDEVAVGSAPASRDGLEAGSHVVKVVKPGYLDHVTRVNVLAGVEARVEARLEKDPDFDAPYVPKVSRRVATISLAGLTVAASATGIALAVLARSAANRADGSTNQAEAFASLERGKDRALAANITFGAAGALGVTSLVLGIVFSKDVFGRKPDKKKVAAPTVKAAAVPLAEGGVFGTLEVRW